MGVGSPMAPATEEGVETRGPGVDGTVVAPGAAGSFAVPRMGTDAQLAAAHGVSLGGTVGQGFAPHGPWDAGAVEHGFAPQGP